VTKSQTIPKKEAGLQFEKKPDADTATI